jgi:hypothetical protein
MALTCGDVSTGRLRAEKALELYRTLGDEWGTAFSLLMSAYAGRMQQAIGWSKRSRSPFWPTLPPTKGESRTPFRCWRRTTGSFVNSMICSLAASRASAESGL